MPEWKTTTGQQTYDEMKADAEYARDELLDDIGPGGITDPIEITRTKFMAFQLYIESVAKAAEAAARVDATMIVAVKVRDK